MPRTYYCLSSARQILFPDPLQVAGSGVGLLPRTCWWRRSHTLVWADCPFQPGKQHSFPVEIPGAGSSGFPMQEAKCQQTQVSTLSAKCSMALAWHCAKKRHCCWFKSTLDWSHRKQGEYFGQASPLACSNTSLQATATDYSQRQDLGLDGPSTAEVIAERKAL